MKLWKKRWFVLSDLCLFYYRGESCSLSLSLFSQLSSSFTRELSVRGDVFAIRVSDLKCERREIISQHVAP